MRHGWLAALGWAACAAAFIAALSGCDGSLAAERETAAVPAEAPAAAPAVSRAPPSDAWLLDQWRDARRDALANPTRIEPPYSEWGGFLAEEPSALGLEFAALSGQTLELTLARPADDGAAGAALGVDVFRIDDAAGSHFTRLSSVEDARDPIALELPANGRYVVRLQPAPRTGALYHLALQVTAVLPSPVRGKVGETHGGAFGARRDGGARKHLGIDLFAPRLTPVRAVADGIATPSGDPLGGKTVWLATPGVSYYYAHLASQAVHEATHVKAGDVVGYVGNTGNAAHTPSHLHFAVFEWNRGGAIDPEPLLGERRFARAPAEPDYFAPDHRTELAAHVTMHRAPTHASVVIERLHGAALAPPRRAGTAAMDAADESLDWLGRTLVPRAGLVLRAGGGPVELLSGAR